MIGALCSNLEHTEQEAWCVYRVNSGDRSWNVDRADVLALLACAQTTRFLSGPHFHTDIDAFIEQVSPLTSTSSRCMFPHPGSSLSACSRGRQRPFADEALEFKTDLIRWLPWLHVDAPAKGAATPGRLKLRH